MIFDNVSTKCPRCNREDCLRYLRFLDALARFREKVKEVEQVPITKLWDSVKNSAPCE